MNKMKSSRQASSKLVLLALVASLGFLALNSKPASGADERALTTDKSDPLYLDKGVTNFVASSLSPDGKYLATPGGGNSILFYEVASGKIIRRLTGASRWISFSADGTQLSALGSDGQIRIWDVESGKQIASVKVGSKLVDDIKQPKLSPDKKLLAFGDSRSLNIVEVADGHQICEIGEPNVFPFGFSFDGKKIVGLIKDTDAFYPFASRIKIWDVASGRQDTVISAKETLYPSFAINPTNYSIAFSNGLLTKTIDCETGKTISTQNGRLSGLSPDGTMMVSDVIALHLAQTILSKVNSNSSPSDLVGLACPDGGFSADSKRMITRDLHSAFFWDTASATKIATLDNPRVITAALNKDGKVCALEIDSENSGPEKVIFHDVLSGKTLRELKIKSDTRYRTGFSLEGFSTDDKTFVYVPLIDSAGKSEVQAWDTASGQLVSKFVLPARCKNFALSPDGKVMACAFFSGKPTVIYELASGKELVTLPKSIQADRFTLCAALRFSLDGKTLYAGTEDSLITFDVSTGKQLKELKLDCCPGSIAITQSGKVLVTGWTELISILDLGGKEIQTLNAPLYGFTNLGFSSDGKKIYGWGGDGRSGLRSWNLKDGHELACIEFPEKNAPKKSLDSIQCLFSSDFNTAVIPGDMSGSIVDLEHGRERLRLPHHTSSIAKIIPKPDGDSLLIVNEDGAVQTLYLKDGTLRSLATLDQKAIHVVPISDGDRVAVDCEDGHSYIIDSKSGQLTKLWRDSSGSMIACADGKTAYKLNQTKPFLTVKSLNDGTELAAPAAISDNEVKDIAVSKNGKTLVTANFSDIKVWKLGSNTLQWQYKKTDPDIWNVASSIAISPDDKLFAAASTDKTVKVWNLETGKLLYTLSGNKDVIGDLSFSPDSKKLATGTQDGRVAIYSTDDGRELKTASTDAGCITSLAFSHDGKLLVSGTKNGTLEFWSADSGRELCTMTPVDNASWVVFDGQGHFDGSAEGKELVHIFKDGLPLPAEETKKQGYKPNLFIERISGTEQVPLAR